jgi:photosystem II stability/assembly factor-like uncharacterized protein
MKYGGFMIKVLHVLLILIIPFNFTISQTSWIWQNPLPHGNTYNSIKFININTGFVVGELGMFYKTTNGGNNWIKVNLNSSVSLNSIYIRNANSGWICGDQGTLYKTIDGGNNWLLKNIGISGNIIDITFINDSIGFFTRKSVDSVSVAKTTNGGNNWIINNLEAIYDGCIGGIYFIDNYTGWTTTLFSWSGGQNQNIVDISVYKTTNGGNSWVYYSLVTSAFINSYSLKSINFINALTGFILTDRELFRTINGGLNWTIVLNDKFYSAIKFFNQNNGIIAGSKIYKTSNFGINWYTVDSTYPVIYKDIFMTDSSKGWLVGTGGIISKTTNNGNFWQDQTYGSKNKINQTIFTDSLFGYSCGNNAFLCKTTNQGYNWVIQNPIVFNLNNLYCINFIDRNTGWIGSDSGFIFKTNNGGTNWSKYYLTLAENVKQILFTQTGTGFAFLINSSVYKSTNFGINWILCYNSNAWAYNMSVVNENIVYVSNSQLVKTTNGGVNWINLTLPQNTYTRDIFFLNENTGWGSFNYSTMYFSYNYLRKTTNGGLNWSNINSFLTKGMYFINESEGYANLDTSLEYTSNGGLNWINLKIASNNINSIGKFGKDLWISGNYGMIMKGQNAFSTAINKISGKIPKEYKLYQNYPNPFNPSTMIRYSLIKNGFVKIKIFDLLGREITILVNNMQNAGEYEIKYINNELSTGVYFYSLYVDGIKIDIKKMILIK